MTSSARTLADLAGREAAADRVLVAALKGSATSPGGAASPGFATSSVQGGAGRDDEAAGWVAGNRSRILDLVERMGWVLLRGLAVTEPAGFRACIAALGLPLADDYGDLPMTPAGVEGVFGVTPFPADHAILFHNEGSHTPRAPRFICFHCALPAREGGETPLAPSGRVLEELPLAIAHALADHGLLYRRSFVEHLDVPWQTYFGTSDRGLVRSRCEAQGIAATWTGEGRLVTETRRPAVVRHPATGRMVFFNQVLLHHPACLDPDVRDAFRFILPAGATPRDVRLGDGSPIPDAWVEAILASHARVAASFRWRAGDIVVADNVAVAHARRPYAGERRHHVVLGGFQAFV